MSSYDTSGSTGRSPYDTSHTSSSSPYDTSHTPVIAGRGGAVASSVAAKPSGGGGFLHTLEDVGHVAKNLGVGLYNVGDTEFQADKYAVTHHTLGYNPYIAKEGRMEKAYVQGEKKIWGPLVTHGSLSGVKGNPIGALLDTVSLVTGGAGALGKGASVLDKAGIVKNDLGYAKDLTAPDYASKVGQPGEQVVIKRSSSNPALKGLQTGKNAALNKLPDTVTIKGHTVTVPGSPAARVTKALVKAPARSGARMVVQAHPLDAAFAKLTKAEKAAWHLKLQAVHPKDYLDYLSTQEDVSPGMTKLLKDPKVAKAFDNPSSRLKTALIEGRKLSQKMSEMKVEAGHITDTAAAESPYRLLRQVHGATRDAEGNLVDQAGHDIPSLAKGLAEAGHEQPVYVPHSTDTGDLSGLYRHKGPAGFAAPGPSNANKQSLGVLAAKGKLAFNQNPILREWSKFRGFTEASQIHDALVQHAAELPKGEPLPKGYEYLKINRGSASAPHLEQVGSQFEHSLDPKFVDNTFTRDGSEDGIAESADGQSRLVVPTKVKTILQGRQVKTAGALYRLLYQQPSSVWKHMVIGLRPASLMNISAGNSILGLLQSAPRYGRTSFFNQVLPHLESVLGKRVTDETMRDVFPEQKLGTFGHTSGFGGVHGGTVRRGFGHAYQGVMPAIIGYENVLRRAMVEGWAKATPEVRAAMKANGGDVNQALRTVAKSHPHTIDEISQRVDDALGNYRSYNQVERTIKQVIPFYGWDRHLIRSMVRLIKEHPGVLDALYQIGQQGAQANDQGVGGLPSFMDGSIGIPKGIAKHLGPLNGRTPLLETSGLLPSSTVGDLAGLLGNHGSSELTSSMNPLITGMVEQLTGTSLETGDPLPRKALGKNIASKVLKDFEELAQVPQVALAKSIVSGPQSRPTSLFQNDWESELANFLGLKVKKTNLPLAHQEAAQGR